MRRIVLLDKDKVKKSIYSKEHTKIAKKLKKARLEAGLTQRQAAKKLKVSQSYISKLEAGQRRIELVQVKKLSKIYKQSLEYFI